MGPKIFLIPAVLLVQTAFAQDSVPASIANPSLTPVTSTASNTTSSGNSSYYPSSEFTQTSIMDYKNVYEAATLEEEVQLATERFNLNRSQQEVWATAATSRRETEKQARATLEKKIEDYSKADVYKGLRLAQNEFYQTIIGYFDPTQKRALEKDMIINEEKRKMIAKLPPPVVTPTVAPVDSTAIKAEIEKMEKDKKAKAKKKKPTGA